MNRHVPNRARWFFLLVAAVLGASALLAAALAWRVQQLGSQAREQLARRLGQASGTQASVRAVQLDLGQASIVASGIELKKHGRSLLSAGSLRARVSLGALLRGRLELSSVEIGSATIQLTAADLQTLERSAGDHAESIASLHLASARIALELGALNRVELPRADLVVSLRPKKRWPGASVGFALRAPRALWMRSGLLAAEAQINLHGDFEPGAQPWQKTRNEV